MSLSRLLRSQIASLIEEAEAILAIPEREQRMLTEDEQKHLLDIQSRIGHRATAEQPASGLWAQVESAEAMEKFVAETRESARENCLGPVTCPPRANLMQPTGASQLPDNFERYVGSLRAFPNTAEGRREAYLFGRVVAATLFAHQDSRDFLARYYPHIYGALGVGSGASGGFLVPEQFEQRIIALILEYGVARRYADVVPMVRDDMVIPRRATGVNAAAVSEGTAISESDPVFAQVAVAAKKWAVLTRYSSELAGDAFISIGDFLAQEFALAFARTEDDVSFNADGSAAYNSMTGLLKDITTNAPASVVVAPSGQTTWDTLTLSTLIKVVATLPKYLGITPRWYVHSYGYYQGMVRAAAAANGTSMTELFTSPQGEPVFLGAPVVFTNVLEGATVGANDTPLLYGDLSRVLVLGDRGGVTIATDASRYFELDQVAIRGTRRFGIKAHSIGDAVNAGGMIVLKMADSE